MGIGETVRTVVVNDSTVAALVEDRVYPVVYPSNPTLPCMTYRVISGFHEPISAEQLSTTRFQFDIWGETYLEVADIKTALANLFYYYDGVVNSQRIITTRMDLNFDTFEQNVKLHRASLDVRVTHEGV